MLRNTLQSLVLLVRRFRGADEAVAAVEFALVMPFLILLYFGSMEAAAAFTVDKRINSISATVGDLVSQWDPADGDLGVGTNSTMSDYFNASTGILAPYSTTGLQIVVSLVQVKADGTTKVLWSQANSAGTPLATNSSLASLPATSRMNQVSRGGCIVASRATYSYLPMLGQVIDTTLTLTHESFFIPRFGSQFPIDLSSTALAATACTAA